MDHLLSSGDFDILDHEVAVNTYNAVIPWLKPDDSRMSIAHGIIEAIYNRTTHEQLRVLCWEARSIYHLHKKEYERSLECLIEGFALHPLETIQLNILKIIPNIKNRELIEKLFALLMNYKSKNISIKHKDAILLFIIDTSLQKIKNQVVYERSLDMMENRSIAMFYKGTCSLLIPQTEAEVKQRYDTHIETIQTLLADQNHVKNIREFLLNYPDVYLEKVGMDLSYTIYENKPLQQLLSRFYSTIYPYLSYVSPHIQSRNTATLETILRKRRIGFVSANLYGHSVGKLFGGVIKYIDREKFEPYLYTIINRSHLGSFAHKYVELPMKDTMKASIELWREMIAADDLDILIYPDIGMIPLTYYLSFSRLAPVQAMWWGHVDSASTAIDYFISSAYFEDKPEHYTEKLIKHPGLSVIYDKLPYSPDPSVTRVSLGLPEKGTIYMCAQHTLKWSPAFNEIVCGILRADPTAVIVGINYFNQDYWKTEVLKRVDKQLGYNATSRIILLPPQHGIPAFLTLCQHATIMIDTIPFSGTTSHLECFSIGKMVITLCGDTLCGSTCTGVYRALGLDTWSPSPIAYTIQEYIAKALYYAHDHNAREQFEKQIIAKMDTFYTSQKEIDGWNQILEQLLST